jgi:hypothetical protein
MVLTSNFARVLAGAKSNVTPCRNVRCSMGSVRVCVCARESDSKRESAQERER